MSSNQVAVNMVKGDTAPRHPGWIELECNQVTITEQGTEGNLPIVDFEMVDAEGIKYMVCFTGRIVNMISSAIKGANMRNHGKAEP